jgi:protein-S-isoprenylcysteine O-methyltransferase Ste14
MERSNGKFAKYIDWQNEQHTPKQKLLFLALQEFFHLLVLPALLFFASKGIDILLKILNPLPASIYIYAGCSVLVAGGLALSLWTRWTQFKLGQGTPAPKMPTQKLIIKGPYAFSRNPMILGDLIWLLGLGGLVNSLSFAGLVLVWFTAHLFYYKLTEEKELEARFGDEYTEYKKRVGFVGPVFRRRRKDTIP